MQIQWEAVDSKANYLAYRWASSLLFYTGLSTL